MTRRVAIMACAILLSIPPATIAADWPGWRGSDRTGISSEKGLLKEWPKSGPRLVWQVNDIGEGYGAPAVAGDNLYLLSNRGMENEFVQALSAKDGKPLWTATLGKVGNPDQQPAYPMAKSTPIVEGNRLYVLSSGGDLAALNRADGKIIWKKNVLAEFAGKAGTWGYSESPLIDGDVLVVTPGGPEATILAVNKNTGSTIFKSAVQAAMLPDTRPSS